MKTYAAFLSFLLVLTGITPEVILAQQDEDVRGAFLTSRPKTSPKSEKSGPQQKPSRRRPKASGKTTTGNAATPATATTASSTAAAPRVVKQRLGLGLTLFMRDSNGLAVRTDPAREFRQGDRVRVLLESNADGFLYIFNSTDGGQPVMIYPDPELDEAGNFIQGHVPIEIPSSVAAEERLRWFTFDQNSGLEKLYFVFTREPLPAVPMEDDLIVFCRDNSSKCPWRPGQDVWAEIQSVLSEPAAVAPLKGLGRSQTDAEQQAVTRGIGLNRDDPEPSLIMLTASTEKKVLVVTLELVHKSKVGTATSNPE